MSMFQRFLSLFYAVIIGILFVFFFSDLLTYFTYFSKIFHLCVNNNTWINEYETGKRR